MDRTRITAALVTAKTIVMSHGISNYLPPHMKTVGARPVEPTDSGFRLDYVLDPAKSMWKDNPGCSIHVNYAPSPKGQRTAEDGSLVNDHNLSITIRASSDDMTIGRMKEREVMISNLMMLCEMLESTLPQTVTTVLMSAADFKEKSQLDMEQVTGSIIHEFIGHHSLKGLRKGGRSRHYNLASFNSSLTDGTYRYTHVRKRNSRGHAVDTAKYVIRVHGASCSIVRTQ